MYVTRGSYSPLFLHDDFVILLDVRLAILMSAQRLPDPTTPLLLAVAPPEPQANAQL